MSARHESGAVLAEWERAEIKRANDCGLVPVVFVGLQQFDQSCQYRCRRIVVSGQLKHLDMRVGVIAPLTRQPVVEHFPLGGRRH